jgi:hypothetical protein
MKFLAQFILFYYESYIHVDWTVITKLGRIYYAPFAFIRNILLWVISPIALPEFLIKRNKFYKKFLKVLEQQKSKNAFI